MSVGSQGRGTGHVSNMYIYFYIIIKRKRGKKGEHQKLGFSFVCYVYAMLGCIPHDVKVQFIGLMEAFKVCFL